MTIKVCHQKFSKNCEKIGNAFTNNLPLILFTGMILGLPISIFTFDLNRIISFTATIWFIGGTLGFWIWDFVRWIDSDETFISKLN